MVTIYLFAIVFKQWASFEAKAFGARETARTSNGGEHEGRKPGYVISLTALNACIILRMFYCIFELVPDGSCIA